MLDFFPVFMEQDQSLGRVLDKWFVDDFTQKSVVLVSLKFSIDSLLRFLFCCPLPTAHLLWPPQFLLG